MEEQGQDLEANRTLGERRLSYNNKRDTRFDSYRESHGSPVVAGQEQYTDVTGSASPDLTIPTVKVENHDAPEVYHAPVSYGNMPHQPHVYEMESRRDLN